MQYITWSDEMVSGISSIDNQHLKLLELINGVHDAICGNKTRADIIKVFDELIEYTVVHFSHEEGVYKK
jgi:hemerythrin-like metal-binding protein